MIFKQYNDIKSFYNDTCGILMRHEAQNLIPLGNIIIGNEGKDKHGWRDPANWFMATVSDSTGIRLTALMTPPHKLTLYATDNKNDNNAIACLINGITASGVAINGVMTENTLAESFTRAYAELKGLKINIVKKQRIHELEQVNKNITSIGNLRLAQDSDMSFLPYWYEAFYSECFRKPMSVQNDAARYYYHIASKNLYILEDNSTPVSMAKIIREMQTVCGIALVYTPPYFRGKGYATSCVAAVSRIVLERGFSKCALYTDLANPVSNSIYKKIGYNTVCDSLEIEFTE